MHFRCGGLRATWREAVDAVPPTLAPAPAPGRNRELRALMRWLLARRSAAAVAFRVSPSACVRIRQALKAVLATTTAWRDRGRRRRHLLTAPLDRSPDFIAWLASRSDAERLAME